MNAYKCSEEQFIKDVSQHTMNIIRDDGVHRHIRFKRPSEGTFWFDIITWPGTLCIDGDMGTHVFRRLGDMFEFFRTDRGLLTRSGNKLAINPGYWAEKLQSVSVFGDGYEKFDPDAFKAHLKESFDEWKQGQIDGEIVGEEALAEFNAKASELWEEIEASIPLDDGDVRAYDAARNFSSHEFEDFNFADCWEWRCKAYTFHFIWCCYAIAWAVKTYDEAKQTAEAA